MNKETIKWLRIALTFNDLAKTLVGADQKRAYDEKDIAISRILETDPEALEVYELLNGFVGLRLVLPVRRSYLTFHCRKAGLTAEGGKALELKLQDWFQANAINVRYASNY